MSILQTIDLKKYYGTEPNITRALDGVNFSVNDGEFVAVVGTSGSGKSTLLHMMGGLDTPTSGNVIVRDKELSKMNDEQLTIFRRRNIGFIFQNYNLVPILNVYENIVLPVELDGDTVDQKFLDEIVHLLGLEDKLKNMPNNLSGGQQQRVAIARALITKPAIVLAAHGGGHLAGGLPDGLPHQGPLQQGDVLRGGTAAAPEQLDPHGGQVGTLVKLQTAGCLHLLKRNQLYDTAGSKLLVLPPEDYRSCR